MRKKQRVLLVLLSAVMVLCASCSARPSKLNQAPLKVEFAWWWGDFTLLVAKDKGFFEKYGVEVEPVYYESFPEAPADLLAGKIDGGLFSIGDVLTASQHADVRAVAVYDDGGVATIIALPEIKMISDLAGKQIGVKIGSPYELFVDEMLRAGGVKFSDVGRVNMSAEEVPDAMPDTVQAGFVWEPYTTQLIERGYRVLFTSSDLSSLYPDLIAFHGSIVEERPEDIRAFLQAWFDAAEYRLQNVEETRQIAAKYLGVSVGDILADGQLQAMTIEDNILLYQKDPPEGVRSLFDTAKISADFLIKIGTLPK